MSIDPSNRWRNAEASLVVWAFGLTVAGAPAMLGQGQPQHKKGLPFVRWSLVPVSDIVVGFAPQRTHRVSALLVASVYWPAVSDADGVGRFDLANAVDDLRDALTTISVTMRDHTVDPVVDLPGAHIIRSVTPPTHQRPRSVDGYDRAVVTAPVFWDAYRDA